MLDEGLIVGILFDYCQYDRCVQHKLIIAIMIGASLGSGIKQAVLWYFIESSNRID